MEPLELELVLLDAAELPEEPEPLDVEEELDVVPVLELPADELEATEDSDEPLAVLPAAPLRLIELVPDDEEALDEGAPLGALPQWVKSAPSTATKARVAADVRGVDEWIMERCGAQPGADPLTLWNGNG